MFWLLWALPCSSFEQRFSPSSSLGQITWIFCCNPVRQCWSACYYDLMGCNSVNSNEALCFGEAQLAVTHLGVLFVLSCKFTLIFKTDPTSREVGGMTSGSLHNFDVRSERKMWNEQDNFTLCWDGMMDWRISVVIVEMCGGCIWGWEVMRTTFVAANLWCFPKLAVKLISEWQRMTAGQKCACRTFVICGSPSST